MNQVLWGISRVSSSAGARYVVQAYSVADNWRGMTGLANGQLDVTETTSTAFSVAVSRSVPVEHNMPMKPRASLSQGEQRDQD